MQHYLNKYTPASPFSVICFIFEKFNPFFPSNQKKICTKNRDVLALNIVPWITVFSMVSFYEFQNPQMIQAVRNHDIMDVDRMIYEVFLPTTSPPLPPNFFLKNEQEKNKTPKNIIIGIGFLL